MSKPMHYPESHYRWEWQLASTPEELWPLVSDTDRFNHATGRGLRRRRRAAACRVQSAGAARGRSGAPGLVIERFQTSLKGIEGHFDVWRVRRPNAKP
jgi:hypothetical protein